eukprot:scaffold32305_cov57-Cyclotella_meneghiniana.AAC.6
MIDNPFRLPQEINTNSLQMRRLQQRLGSEKPEPRRSTKQRESKTNTSNDSQMHSPHQPIPPVEAMYRQNDILSRGNPDHRMSLKEFVSKKREMLMLNMQIETQQENIKMLGMQLKDREDELKAKEERLTESIKKFDAFLKETDEKTRNAQRLAEEETAKRDMKQQEIADIKNQLKAVEFLIAKHKNDLEECSRSKQFIDSLTPPSWFDKCAAEKKKRQQQRRKERIKARQEAYKKALSNQKLDDDKVKNPSKGTGITAEKQVNHFEDEPMTSSDEDIPIYFQNPEDLNAKIEESLHLRTESNDGGSKAINPIETEDGSMQSACAIESGIGTDSHSENAADGTVT